MSKKTTEDIKPLLKMHVIKSVSTERAASNALEDDPFLSSYGEGGIIQPPYDLLTLSTLPENCSELRPSLDAMTVNIEKLGHRIVPRKGIVGKNEEIPEDIKKELYAVENFFNNAVLDEDIGTFIELRSRHRTDLELTGNSYKEVIPSIADSSIPAGLNHIPSWTVRLKKQDDYLTDYDAYRSVRVSEKKWEIQKFPTSKRFRRFVQIRDGGVTKVWFKEWNDPRDIDSRTGELFEGPVDEKYLAHEMIHFKLYSSRSPYGLPRIIGHLFSIYGVRGAEEINYVTLDNNQIPALALLATNVAISDGSIKRMTEFIEERVQGNKNYATILVIEAEPTGEGMRDPGAMKLEIKPLTEFQHTDAMFKEYISMGNNTIRRAFRLPPIFSGLAEDYNRAVAEASRKLAEEQIFAPERDAYDIKLTNTLIVRMGYASSKLKSNTPNVTDNYELTQMLAVAETGGGLTPRTSASIIEDISGKDIPDPLPEINPDLPYSITKLREELAAKYKIAQVSGENSNENSNELEEIKKNVDISRIVQNLLIKDHEKAFLDSGAKHDLMMLSFLLGRN